MQIVIPMTGYGSRFVSAGYKELKPFINVMGHPILEWIIKKIYPEEKNILFVCRKEHIDSIPNFEKTLLDICPTGKIYAVDPWIKLGPVYDVLRASDEIEDDDPVIVNYCDFFMVWDWFKFKKEVIERNCEGCIPCYTGFHPHLLRENNVYASCRCNPEGELIEIREKYSFESDKAKAKHSPGTYFFKNGKLLKKYCQKLIDEKEMINGEYYMSLPYNYMVEDGLKVWVPTNVDFFCQWGTPEDLKEFEFWIKTIKGEYECKF